MNFQDALAATDGYRAVARPVGSTLREGLGWRLDGGRIVWYDPTAIVDLVQYATQRIPLPSADQLRGEWEVVGV